MKPILSGLVATSLALGIVACKSNAPDAKPGPASTAAASASAAPSAPAPSPFASSSSGLPSPIAIPGATVAAFPNESFPERFAAEAKARPAGITPTAEQVYAALRDAGVDVVDARQHLASPQGARFCLGARVAGADKETGLDLSACEYSSPEVARVARDYSIETMKTVIPNRTVYANKQTTLTVREAQKTPDADALVARIAAAFAKL